MDKIEKYKKIIQEELKYQATKTLYNAPNVKRQLIINAEKTDFILLSLGWDDDNFLHTILFHYQIKDNKVWLMKNNTNVLINQIMIENGIHKNDITIGWIPDYLREVMLVN